MHVHLTFGAGTAAAVRALLVITNEALMEPQPGPAHCI